MSQHLARQGLARRIALAQLAAGVAVAAVAAALDGLQAGASGFAGALAVLLGALTMARLAFGGGIQSGEGVLLRLLVGVAGKWLVIAVVLLLALVALRLPPLPAIAGVGAALLATTVASMRGQ